MHLDKKIGAVVRSKHHLFACLVRDIKLIITKTCCMLQSVRTSNSPYDVVIWKALPYARFAFADSMPRLASDVVGGKSGRNHPTSRRDPIHILAERRAMRTFASVGTMESYNIVYCTTIHYNSQLRWTRSAPDRPTTSRWSPDEAPDSRFRVGNPFTMHYGRADSIGVQSGRRIG